MSDGYGIDRFISEIGRRNGLAKPNWWMLNITNPQLDSDISRTVSLFAESAQFPGINISTAALRTYGVPIEYPFMKTYDPISVIFLVDTGFYVKSFFDNWMNLIIDDTEDGTYDVGFMSDYATQLQISQLNPNDASISYQIELQNAYPTVVQPVDVSHSIQNQFHKLHVQFCYTKIIVRQNIPQAAAGIPANPTLPAQLVSPSSNTNMLQTLAMNQTPFSALLGQNANQINTISNGVLNSAQNYLDTNNISMNVPQTSIANLFTRT